MAYRKEIIIIGGGRHRGVVKLSGSSDGSGVLRGACTLDFDPSGGRLYLINSAIAEITVEGRETKFDISGFANEGVSCYLVSGGKTLFGSAPGGMRQAEAAMRVDKSIRERAAMKRADDKKEGISAKNEEPSVSVEEQDVPTEENAVECDDLQEKGDSAAAAAGGDLSAFAFGESVRYDGSNFYAAIKPQLDEMFVCYPREESIEILVPNSQWVRVDADGEVYVVGILFDGDVPAFICYGIPGEYSVKPPKQYDSICVWLPADAERAEDKGYWVIYQSAVNGKILK